MQLMYVMFLINIIGTIRFSYNNYGENTKIKL